VRGYLSILGKIRKGGGHKRGGKEIQIHSIWEKKRGLPGQGAKFVIQSWVGGVRRAGDHCWKERAFTWSAGMTQGKTIPITTVVDERNGYFEDSGNVS